MSISIEMRYAQVRTAMRSAFSAWWTDQVIPPGLKALPLLVWRNGTVKPQAGECWIEPVVIWGEGSQFGQVGHRTFDETGIIQTDIYVPSGSGDGAGALIAGMAAAGWRSIQPHVLGLRVYRTSPPNELPSAPEGSYGEQVTTSIRWIAGEADMGEETYLWNQKRIATGAYAVGDVMVYAAGDTVQRSTGAPEEVFAGIARNTGTSGSACTMAKPPGLVLVKNGLSSPAPVGLSLDAGVNGSAVAALGTRTLGVLTRSALPTDSRVLVDLRT